MLCCSCSTSRCAALRSWFRDYDKIQSAAVVLIYIQIACALAGSLGALYNGVLLINLVVALFALIAIESNSQSLARTYAALLACAIMLDVAWFVLFSHAIWNISADKYGPFFIFSVRLALCMQIIGFSVRSLSSLLWIQMYRLGVSSVENTAYREVDFDLRNNFMNPASPSLATQNSVSDDILGGSIYDPAYYSSLFEDPKSNFRGERAERQITFDDGGASSPDSSQLRSCVGRSFQFNSCK